MADPQKSPGSGQGGYSRIRKPNSFYTIFGFYESCHLAHFTIITI